MEESGSSCTDRGLALVWVNEGFGQGLIDMGGRVGASSVPMEQFMHLSGEEE